LISLLIVLKFIYSNDLEKYKEKETHQEQLYYFYICLVGSWCM